MLRITIHNDAEVLTFQLEGRLAGTWVPELEQCWRSTPHPTLSPEGRGQGEWRPTVRFDLTGVTFIDAAGKAFLAARHGEGARLVAAGCLMRAIVAEITNAPISECGCPNSGGKNQL